MPDRPSVRDTASAGPAGRHRDRGGAGEPDRARERSRDRARDRDRERGRSTRAGRGAGSLTDRVFVGFDLVLVVLLGVLHALPTAYPRFWWVQLLCVAGLAFRVSRASVGRAALLGLVFGTAWLCMGTWWLYVSMHRYGGLSSVLSMLAVLGLSAFLSLYLAIAMGVFAAARRHRLWIDTLIFSGCWLLAELARGWVLTGFPWAASGYAHVDSPLSALAPYLGVYGIGAVAALVAAAPALGLRDPDQPGGVGAIGLAFSGVVLAGLAFVHFPTFTVPTGTLRLSLLQSNVPQNEKFSTEVIPQNLEWAARQLVGARGDLVVAPETIIPLLPEQLPDAYWQPLQRHFQRGNQAALFGVPLGNAETGYTNSAVGISRDTVRAADGTYRYDKHHLVPFGEFIPAGFRWFTNLMNIPLGDFARGPLVAASFDVKGERVAPNICFEDLFGEELAARFADEPVAPTVFANLTNIGWFGDTIAVRQHLHISRMRTLEFQRPMVRATNTGTTAVIDHTGRVTHALEPFTQGVLEATVTGRRGLTPFAGWSSGAGLLPLVIAGLLPLLAAVVLRRRDG